MVVTGIKNSKKGNILIYADNNYLVSVLPEVFSKSGIKVGSYIDENILENLREKINLTKAKEKALNLLSFRAHSKKELTDKVKRSLGEKCAEDAVNKMEKLGLINDEEFANSYAKELFERKLYSIKRIKYELSKKGISSDISEKIMSSFDFDEPENIKKILSKKKFTQETKNNEKEYRKMVAYCQRLGYSWSDISSAINDF